MPAITDWVIGTACQAAAAWPDITVAVNVAASDAVRSSLITAIRRAVAESSLPPTRLTIEVTEHALVTDLDRATRNLRRLANDGIQISLDDFGTGYSSLLYLRQLPISEIKVDRVFTDGLTRNAEDDAIVSGVIRLALAVGARVVAEGVETEAQARRLIELGCHRAQGYLFGKPEPALRRVPLVVLAKDARVRRQRPRRNAQIPPNVVAVVGDLLAHGASLHTIAAVLNQRGHRTSHGTRWTAPTVARVLAAMPGEGEFLDVTDPPE
jgi:EAL domain-containing protein (putative c-di-GMP-specific phosphodiesterase class I)